MGIYAISDLHLSLKNERSMDIFGDKWKDHFIKIEENWNKIIKEDDIVLVSGDISWALNMEDAKIDLDFIEKLNGKKILGYGNHDFWWNSTNKLNTLYNSIFFLRRNYYIHNNYIICGTKGSNCPSDTFFEKKDEKLYIKETKRLENTIIEAKNIAEEKGLEIIVMLHYPPTNDKLENSLYTQILKEHNIKTVIFGHLHKNFKKALNGKIGDTEYFLTSCDYLRFSPILIK